MVTETWVGRLVERYADREVEDPDAIIPERQKLLPISPYYMTLGNFGPEGLGRDDG